MKQIMHVLGLSIAVVCSAVSASAFDLRETGPTCGDFDCNGYEDKYSCPQDCGSGELDGCQWLFQIVTTVAPELHSLFQRNAEDALPCERIGRDCGNDREFLMSISCNTYAEICEDTEIMCE